jgi:hypothetical protein
MQLIGQFEFISSFGRLLQAYTDGEMHASQEPGAIGREERWNVYTVRDNIISIQNCRNNNWLCAEENGRAVCDRGVPGDWEEWAMYGNGDHRTISLRSYHGKWLCAQAPGDDTKFGGEVIADRVSAGRWERWVMLPSEQLQGESRDWMKMLESALEKGGELAPLALGG